MHVMSWIPPYAIDQSIESLESFKEWAHPSPLTVINRIGLQYWIPSQNSRAQLVRNYGASPSPDDVRRSADYCRQYEIAPFLCIYNYDGVDWNWNLAVRAFSEHRDRFIESLLDEVERYDLSGIDIDFEGQGDCSAYQEPFKEFIIQLSTELRKRDKLLSVDIFHNPELQAPNLSWVGDWKDHVDTVQTMGYNELYGGADAPYNYSSQVEIALGQKKVPCEKFLIGLPGWLAEWGRGGLGSSPIDHLNEIIELSDPVGLCIWDTQLLGEPWRTPEVWELINQIKLRAIQNSSKNCCSDLL